jgi:hypothetical protein
MSGNATYVGGGKTMAERRYGSHKYLESSFFPSHAGVGYGTSSFNVPVVTHDPFRFSVSRVAIYATIAVGILWAVLRLKKLDSVVPSTATKLKKLVMLTGLSVVASGVHHFDNFLRVEKYYLASWIYNGHFFILDIGIANWVIASLFALTGIEMLVDRSASPGSDVGSYIFATRLIYVHCVMIWSGQLHYSLESIFNFEWDANISILAEGTFAILLHVYLWRNCQSLIDRTACLGDSYLQYSQVPTDDDAGDISLVSVPNNVTAVRRRSKDASNP